MNTLLETIEIETGPNPQAAVIWMHGLGADGNDFAPMVPELNLTGCPNIRFVFPHAPMIPVTINNGYVMRAWYDIFAMDLVRREDEGGIAKSAKQIDALIDREKQRGISTQKIVLAGFSQGCAMTLYTGLRHVESLAGLVALSGYLPLAAKTAQESSQANANIPILMAHGSMDPVVPQARAQASREILTELGYSVQWHSYPMPHSVHPQEIAEIAQFLRRVLVV
jgi:phospholipase/carboxylesterase